MVLICPITPPEDGLVYTTDNVKLIINAKTIGKGVLYISQNSLSWQPDDKAEGMSFQWKEINVHGVSNNPRKCIYFMIEHELHWPGVYEGRDLNGNAAPAAANEPQNNVENVQVDDEEDEGNVTDEEDEFPITEFFLLPDDENSVEIIFRAMNDCQELNPDPADSISDESDFMDDEGEGNFYVPNAAQPHIEDDADAIAVPGGQGEMRIPNIDGIHLDSDDDGIS